VVVSHLDATHISGRIEHHVYGRNYSPASNPAINRFRVAGAKPAAMPSTVPLAQRPRNR
jgi:hypothetical protein